MSTWFDRDSRPIDDLLGEALYRYVNGAMRPLWADMPEGAEKQRWREKGRAIFDFASTVATARVTIREGSVKKNTNDAPEGPRPPAPRSQFARKGKIGGGNVE